MKKVAIIGMGYVGNSMLNIFPEAIQYDINKGTKEEVNEAKLAIICVPTPAKENGECDTSIVEEVISWLETDLILIKSALAPGTTEKLKNKTNKRIVVSPEYVGESKYYIPERYLDKDNPLKHEFLILGGDEKDCIEIADIFAPKIGPVARIRMMSSTEAELVKYAENSFFATKVIFANELREICEAMGANWHRVREGWLEDPRINRMHTAAFLEKGFGGKCFPKDTSALLKTSEKYGVRSYILKAIIDKNKEYQK